MGLPKAVRAALSLVVAVLLFKAFSPREPFRTSSAAAQAQAAQPAKGGVRIPLAPPPPSPPPSAPLPPTPGGGYLLPIICATTNCYDTKQKLDMGPNNQYKAFRHAAVIARGLGRTLVLQEFSVHHSESKLWWKEPPTWWKFNDTFDQEGLQKIVKTITLAEFLAKSKGELDLLISSSKLEPGTTKRLETGRLITITDPLQQMSRYHITAKRKDWGQNTTWQHLKTISAGLQYVAIRIDHFGLPLQQEPKWCENLKMIHKGLNHGKDVRDVADQYLARELNGEEYLAVHFRLADSCGNSPPDFASCYHQVPFGVIWRRLVKECEKMGIKHIFIASPPLLHWILMFTSATTVDKFERKKETAKVKLHYTSIHKNDKKLGSWFKNNYKVSLLDQELCVRAKKFVYAGPTKFCLKTSNCTAAQVPLWKPDKRGQVPCCKDGINDMRIYGESFGGNLAEERWAHGKDSVDIVTLFDMNSEYDPGSVNCYRDDSAHFGGVHKMTGLEQST